MAVNNRACVVLYLGDVTLCGHLDRAQLEKNLAAIQTALSELDIAEGVPGNNDEAEIDLHAGPSRRAL